MCCSSFPPRSQLWVFLLNVNCLSLYDYGISFFNWNQGRSGGACTSTLLNILYGTADDEAGPVKQSFTGVLESMRDQLRAKGYSQVPQLTSLNPIDVTSDFQLVPTEATGTRRAVMIGIEYVGHEQGVLRGCHNDVLNMQKYLRDVQGFGDENIHLLMDDGIHMAPTKDNILNAYRQIIADSDDGDVIFLHYSGMYLV